jgi:hypothetical protein
MQRRFTWLAIIVTFILLIPGELLGLLISFLYRWGMESFLIGNPIFDWLTGGWGVIVMLVGFGSIVAHCVVCLELQFSTC